jgi:hypothetical protein
MCRLFIMMHQPRIARNVSSQYCRQLALDANWPLLHHGPISNLDPFLQWIGQDAHQG